MEYSFNFATAEVIRAVKDAVAVIRNQYLADERTCADSETRTDLAVHRDNTDYCLEEIHVKLVRLLDGNNPPPSACKMGEPLVACGPTNSSEAA